MLQPREIEGAAVTENCAYQWYCPCAGKEKSFRTRAENWAEDDREIVSCSMVGKEAVVRPERVARLGRQMLEE